MIPKVKIAVITLNYNSSGHTLRCVRSILKYATERSNFVIIVVDNASTSHDRQQLKTLSADEAMLVCSDKNLGFSGGMMLGMQHVEAEYYFFLNNDCELRDDALSTLSHFMELNKDAALCGGSMVDINGQPRSSFNYFPSLASEIFGNGILRLLRPGRYTRRHRIYTQPIQVDVVSGAAMFVRGTALRQLHGLDTGYFLYCEEEDFAWRAGKAGWKAYLVPQTVISHIGGASSSDVSLRAALQREYYISFFRYLHLHHGSVYTAVFRLLTSVKVLRRALSGKVGFDLVGFILRGAPQKESLRYRQ